jgi:small subunit ribosomal protein S4
MTEYGLKNLKELWKAESEIGKVRRNARELLSGASSHLEETRERMTERLARIGIASKGATLDSLLDLNERALLDRRLQTIVFKRGLATTIKQARQLITHGFIAIGGNRTNKPSYIVETSEESKIGYYKPIDITRKEKPPVRAEVQSAEQAVPEPKAAEAKEAEAGPKETKE